MGVSRVPNGRLVHYTYGTAGGVSDVLGRVDAIKDDNGGSPGGTLAAYAYLGAGTIVSEDYAQPDVKLDYSPSGNYGGFDRFGRVVDQLWRDYGANADADRFKYGHDRAGNRVWKENNVAANLATPIHLDELYDHDELYQLLATDRGNLGAARDGIVPGTKTLSQDWNLDGTGNWSGFNEDTDGDGTNNLDQTRTANPANELTGIAADTGQPQWSTPSHDAAGNMVTMPKPSDPANSITAKYDAWNRLVEVTDSGILIAKFKYDATGRRILKAFDSDSPGSPDGLDRYEHIYLDGQQVIETRETTTESTAPETIQPKYQNIWSPRYIDALILRDENTDTDTLCDDTRLYYLSDANHNVTALIDTTGNILERYIYTPYGTATILDANFTPDPDNTSDHSTTTLYTGRELDPATGLYHYRARYYHPQLGKFTTRDPIGYEGEDVNLYRYVANGPTHGSDPEGLREFTLEFVYHFDETRLTPGIKKEVDRIFQDAVKRFAHKDHTLVITWTAVDNEADYEKKCFGVTWSNWVTRSGARVGIQEDPNSPYAGQGGDFEGSFNRNRVKDLLDDSHSPIQSMDIAIATTIAHEIGLHGIAGGISSIFSRPLRNKGHFHEKGYVDSMQGEMGGVFSEGLAKFIISRLDMDDGDRLWDPRK